MHSSCGVGNRLDRALGFKGPFARPSGGYVGSVVGVYTAGAGMNRGPVSCTEEGEEGEEEGRGDEGEGGEDGGGGGEAPSMSTAEIICCSGSGGKVSAGTSSTISFSFEELSETVVSALVPTWGGGACC